MLESMTIIEWMELLRFSLPLLVIFGTGCLVLLLSAFASDSESNYAGPITIAAIASAFVIAWQLWPEASGVKLAMLRFDRLTIVSWLVITISALASAALSFPYLKSRRLPAGEYYALVLFGAFGMGLLVAAADLVTVLLGLEVMSLAAYALTGYKRNQTASLEGAIKYFLTGAFATAFFLMGVAFLIGSAGTTDLSTLANRAIDIAGSEGRAFFLFGAAMAAIGFSFKVAAAPFHAWAPDAYEGAPTPIAAFMATGIKAAAFVAFARFAIAVAASGGVFWHHMIWGIAVLTMAWGNLAAIRQENLKRMLAYSSIAHAGYVLVIFPSILVSPTGALRAIILYLTAYIITTIGAFAVVVAVGVTDAAPATISGVLGLGKKRPWLAAVFTLFLVSLAGIPPTLGFFGKYSLFLAAVHNGDALLVIVAVLASVVSVFYYLRPVVAMYFMSREEGEVTASTAISPAIAAVLALAAMAVLALGILPQNLVAFVQGSVF